MQRRRPGRRARRVIGAVAIAGLAIYGAVQLGLGISAFGNEHALATSGVPVIARVTATSGYGQDTIQVSYPVHGRQVRGTVGADTSSVSDGQVVEVVYDPANPQVVSLPSAVGDDSSAWADVLIGGFFLLLFPAAFVISALSLRRKRQRAVRAALGE